MKVECGVTGCPNPAIAQCRLCGLALCKEYAVSSPSGEEELNRLLSLGWLRETASRIREARAKNRSCPCVLDAWVGVRRNSKERSRTSIRRDHLY